MKKLLSMIMVVALILAVATTVNAASVSVDKTEVSKGTEVVVSVNLEQETRNIDFKLAYDSAKFEYVAGSASSSLGSLTVNATSDKVIVSGAHATQSTKLVTLKFVAKETTDAAAFTLSGLVTESDEALTNATVSVKVVEAAAGENTGSGEGTGTGSDVKVDEDGNVISSLPQTGVPYAMIAIAIVAVVTVVGLVARKK